MAEYNNEPLREALRVMKEEKSDKAIKEMARILIGSNLLVPARWDKEPTMTKDHQMIFQPNTNFQFALASNKNKEQFLVIFTSNYDYKHWDEKQLFKPMVIGFNQLMPLIEQLPGIQGIVVDPTDVNICLPLPFLQQFKKLQDAALEKNSNIEKKRFKQGENIKLKNAVGKENLENAIIQFGKAHEEIASIYLKVRAEENEDEHWFVIVDMDPQNPNLFQQLGNAMHPFDEGKKMEFMFARYDISQKIMNDSKPVYVREFKNGLS